MMTIDLSGKVAWVTGASRGIGKAIAMQLAAAGTQVVLAGRDQDSLTRLKDEIQEKTGTNSLIFAYDVNDHAQIKTAFTEFNKLSKHLDILVNNAGILESALLPMLTPAQLKKMFQVNSEAAIYHMQYAVRLMTRRQSGSIINVSSIMGRLGEVGQTAYAASKAAVIGASLSVAKEYAPQQIRVNVVAPGFINTDMAHNISECKFKERLSSIKMQRIGEPAEIANTVVFLASDLASYITGQIIGVDGGMVL